MDIENFQFLTNADPLVVGAGILAFVAGLVTVFLLLRKRRSGDEKQIEKTIAKTSEHFVTDVIISDGLYGYHFIDYMVLLPEQILVLGVQHFEGHVFGAENIDEWALVVNKKSYKFDNHLHQYQVCAQTLNGLVKGLNMQARVVFTSLSNFPKGVPEGVWQMDDFSDELEKLGGNKDAENSLKQLWDELLVITSQQKAEYQKEN